MKKQLTKVFVSLLALLIVASLVVFPTTVVDQTVTAQEPPTGLTLKPPTGTDSPQFLDPSLTAAAQEEAMNIIQNVIQADLSKYTIILKANSIMDDMPGSLANRKITNLLYALTPIDGNNNGNSAIEVAFSFEKDILTSYIITPLDSQVIATTHYANRYDAIVDFLEKYQQTTKIDSSNLMAILNNVDLSKNSTTTQENIKLDVRGITFWGVEQTQVKWTYTVNGADYTKLEIIVNANDNVVSVFDTRALYAIGSTAVNISEEQAIDIALENLKDYSYEMSDGSVVSGFKVSRSNVVATLLTSPVGYELRPYWDVRMWLDEVYPGNVHGISVGIWADTGETSAYGNMAYGGVVNADTNSAINSTVAAKQNSNNLLIGIAIIAVIVVAATSMLLVRKRRK